MRLAVVLLVGLLNFLPRAAVAEDICEIAGVNLAHCSEPMQTFRSVVLAVPGWTGKCDSSFGLGAGNLLNIVRHDIGFFDVDCFDFRPHDTPFETIREELWARITTLRSQGYQDIAFVTHSTGGIVVSDLIQWQAFDESGAVRLGDDRAGLFGPDKPVMRGHFAWAVPFNGLTPGIDGLQQFANLLDLSPALLPHMSADAPYLLAQQEGWKRLAQMVIKAAPADRARYKFPWLIMQGQGADVVVEPVGDDDAWFQQSWAELVETGAFHTATVSEAGTQDVPKYPGKVMTGLLLANMPFSPRYDAIFGATAPNTDVNIVRQAQVLRAILNLAKTYNMFGTVRPHINDFVVRLLEEDYPRNSAFDARAIRAIANLLEEVIAQQGDGAVVEFGDDLISTIERAFPQAYQPRASVVAFGGGSARAVRELTDGVNRVAIRVLTLLDGNPALVSALRSSGSRDEFERRYLAVAARLLSVPDDATRDGVVASLQGTTGYINADVLLDSAILGDVLAYAKLRPGSYEEIGRLVETMQQLSPELNEQVLQLVLPELPDGLRGQDALWNRIFTDQQAQQLLNNAQAINAESTATARLLSEIVARGSVSGSTGGLATSTLTGLDVKFGGIGQALPDGWASAVQQGLAESKFPRVEMLGRDLLMQHGID